MSQDRISNIDGSAFQCLADFMSGHLTEYDALFARTPSMHLLEYLRDGCIVSTQTMQELRQVQGSELQSVLLVNPSRNFLQNLKKNLTQQTSITIVSNLHSSLSISDIPCVLFRSYDEDFLRQIQRLTVIGAIEVQGKRELVYLVTYIPSSCPLHQTCYYIAVTPAMRQDASSTDVIIAGTVGTFDEEVKLLIQGFGLAYIKKPQQPIIALTDQENRCVVCLRASKISINQLQALMLKVEEMYEKVLQQIEGRSQIELQVWYRFAPLEGIPGNSVNFVDLPYAINSAKTKDEAFQVHCILNQHRLMNAFHSAPGKYLRIFADPYQLQKVILGLRQKQLTIPDSLALHAARFHIFNVKTSHEVFAWKVTQPFNSTEVSLQITFHNCTGDMQDIIEGLEHIKVPVQYRGIVHVLAGTDVVMPAVHVTATATTADLLVQCQYLDLPCGRTDVQLLREVVDAPKWNSKPINHISENPREHFLNCRSGSDKIGQGRLIHVRARDEYHPLSKQRIASTVWHKDDLETHFLIIDRQAPYVVMTGKCEDVPELIKLQSVQTLLNQNEDFQGWMLPENLPEASQEDEDFTAELGSIKIELEIPLILKNGYRPACHPGSSASNNVLISLHQGALLFLPRCHSCDIIKLIGINPSVIYAFNICTDDRSKAASASDPNKATRANHQDGKAGNAAIEQSDTAQCPTLLHERPPAGTIKGNDGQVTNKLPENPVAVQPSQERWTGKRNIENSREKVETARRRNTVLRFQAEVPANVQEEVQRRIAGLYCPVAAAYRIISCAQWSKENCQHYAPFPKQAALVLAAIGYNIRETARAKLAHILGQTYLELASVTPLELQSFTEVYSKAIWAIPANGQYTLLVQIHCKCSKCQQPQPILALPLHSEQDSSDQFNILADLGQLADLAIACMQQNLSPRNDTCKLDIQRLPSFFCLLTQKTQKSSFEQVCKSEGDIQNFLGSTVHVMQQAYNVVALVLHDPGAKHYLVLHHAREQSGDSILLYDSIYGVRKENLWAQLIKAKLHMPSSLGVLVLISFIPPLLSLIPSVRSFGTTLILARRQFNKYWAKHSQLNRQKRPRLQQVGTALSLLQPI